MLMLQLISFAGNKAFTHSKNHLGMYICSFYVITLKIRREYTWKQKCLGAEYACAYNFCVSHFIF